MISALFEAIVIKDNVTGISKDRADHDLDSLDASWKRQVRQDTRPCTTIHCKEGRGPVRGSTLNPLPHEQDIVPTHKRFAFGTVQCPTISNSQRSRTRSVTLPLNGFSHLARHMRVIRKHVTDQGEIVP